MKNKITYNKSQKPLFKEMFEAAKAAGLSKFNVYISFFRLDIELYYEGD